MIGPHSIVIVKYSTVLKCAESLAAAKATLIIAANAQAAALTATGPQHWPQRAGHSAQATARRPQNRLQQSPQRADGSIIRYSE